MNTAPPNGSEASYEWYLPQYPDPNWFTPIGPPADPCDAAVSASGQLFSSTAEHVCHGMAYRCLPGDSGYIRRALVFALFEDGQVVPMGEGEPARQSLLDGFLPIVRTDWRHGSVAVAQTAFAEPLRGTEYASLRERTLAWAALDLTNESAEERDVTILTFLVGDEKTPRLDLTESGGVVSAGEQALFSVRPPDGFGRTFAPVFPADAPAETAEEALALLESRNGALNAMLVTGRLSPGETRRVLVNRALDPGPNIFLPSDPVGPSVRPEELLARSFDEGLAHARGRWQRVAERTSPFRTPDSAVNNLYRKAMLDGRFLTKRWDGQDIVFDSVIYRCQWDNPSMAWVYALDAMGDHETAERLLDAVFARQGRRKPAGARTHEGCFSDVTNIVEDGSFASWASANGWALWAMAEHARLTGDREWLAKHKDAIVEGFRWIARERAFSLEDPDNPCRGLLHGKFVCDLPGDANVGESGYFTYTDAINYVGIHETGCLLRDWGYPEADEVLREAEAYRQDIVAAVDRLTDRSRDPWYVPWVLSAPRYEHRYFHDIVGPINLAYICPNGGVLAPDDPMIDHVIRWIVDRTHGGSLEHVVAGDKAPVLDGGSAFYSQDLALVLLARDRVEEFLRMLYCLLAAGVSQQTLTTTEWGYNTQPHIHSIAGLARMLRAMLVQERAGELLLLQGTPRRWLASGEVIEIDRAPTAYGPVSLRCEADVDAGNVTVRITMPERIGDTPVRLRLRLPDGLHIARATIDGQADAQVDGEWITLRGLSGEVSLVIEATP